MVGIDRATPAPDSPTARLADLLLDAKPADLPAAVREFSSGRGADVVLNAAGGPCFEIALGVLGHRGRQIEITAPSEPRVSFNLIKFYHNESQLLGLDPLKLDLAASARILEQIRKGFDEGAFYAPVIARTLPLRDASEAYELVAHGERGRVVLDPHAK